jgi:ABC-type Zn uptake system ZnuABC Zn-binding protein ZnuA
MRMGRRAVVVAALGLSVALPTVGEAQNSAVGEPLRVVATFSILGDLVAAVGGDAIVLETIVDAGTDAHTFEPAPDDAIALSEADLVFANGVGFEPWLDELAEGRTSRCRSWPSARGSTCGRPAPATTPKAGAHAEGGTPEGEEVAVDGGEARDDESDGDEPHAEDNLGGDRDHGAYDPHVWHDVRNAIAMTETIRDALAAADPANAARFEANAVAFLADLEMLDAWVIEQVATLPAGAAQAGHLPRHLWLLRRPLRLRGRRHRARCRLDRRRRPRGSGDRRPRRADRGGGGARHLRRERPESGGDGVDRRGGGCLPGPDALHRRPERAGGEADSYEAMVRHNVETIVGALGG